jgi:hypothetical protein
MKKIKAWHLLTAALLAGAAIYKLKQAKKEYEKAV